MDSKGSTGVPLGSDRSTRPLLAVLPYFSLDSLLSRAFTRGVTLRITELLSHVDELRVTAPASTINIPRNLTIPEIHQRLGVDYVLRGQIIRLDQTLYFTQWLYDAPTGALIFEHKTVCGLGQLEEFERDVLARVVADIRQPLKAYEVDRIMGAPPRSRSAYELALRAQVTMCRLDRRSFSMAKKLLLSALESDPDYATAYAWLARYYSIRVGQGWSCDRAADAREAKRLADHAVKLDPNNSVALATAGHLASYLHREYEQGERLLRHAIRVSPNEPLGYLYLSGTLAYTERGREGRTWVEYALTLSPLDSLSYFFFNFAALCCYAEGDYACAITYARRANSLNPNYTTSLKVLAASLVAQGQVTEARAFGALLRQSEPTYTASTAQRTVPFRDTAIRTQFVRQMQAAGCFEVRDRHYRGIGT